MLYTFLISIVFIAEIIITIALLKILVSIDRKVCYINETIVAAKSSIVDISELMHKISEQIKLFAEDFVDKYKTYSEDLILRTLSKILISIVLIKTNLKTINKFRKSKLGKSVAKTLSILESMV